MPGDPPDEAPTGGDEDTGEEPVDSPAGEPADPDGYENGDSTEDDGDAPAEGNSPEPEDGEETGEPEAAETGDGESTAEGEEEEEVGDEPGDEDEDGDEPEDAVEDDGETGEGEGEDKAVEDGEGEDDEREELEADEAEGDEEEDSEAEGDEEEDSEAEGEDEEDSEAEGEDEEDSEAEGEDEEELEDEDGEGDPEDGEDGDSEDEGEDDDESAAEDEEDDAEDSEEDDDGMVEMHDDTTPIQRKTGGPESDKEQPLADHIEEMIKRLAIVVIVAGVVSLMAFPFGEDFIIFLWYSVLPADISQPHVYHPLELVITQLKAASLLGLVLALPVFVYETYAFMRPGLFPHERRYYLAAVPTSLILASVGLLFGYFLVLPAVMTYFLYYSRDVVDIAFALGQTFNLMLILLGYLAVVFQIPLFVMLAIMMGLVTRQWLEDRRLIFWGAFLGLSFLFSPDPTGMAPIIVAATMVGLFEGTLFLLRWTRHR